MVMNNTLMQEIFSRLRPLGFGGLLGAGLMGLSYILLKEKVPQDITYHYFLTVGGLIGAGFHKIIGSIYSNVTCGSIGRFVLLFEKLIKLFIMSPLISSETYKQIAETIAIETVGISNKNQKLISDNIARSQLESQKQKLALLEFESSNNRRSFVEVSDKIQRMQLESEKSIDDVNKTFEQMDKQINKRVEDSLLKITNVNKKIEQKKVTRGKTSNEN